MSEQTDAQKTCELASSLPAPMAVDILTDAILRGDRKAQARIAELEAALAAKTLAELPAHMGMNDNDQPQEKETP